MSEGNLIDPFTDLKTALENTRLADGQVIYLRAGTHYLYEDTTISKNGVTIQPYQDEVAVISFKPIANAPCYLSINGDNVRFRNLEITSEPTNRESPGHGDHSGVQLGWLAVVGAAPSDGVFRNCTLHDLASCLWYSDSQGGVVYKDCTFYNFGWPITGGGADGEFLYTQNGGALPMKYVENCLFGPCFEIAFQVYAESLYPDGSSKANHYTFDECVWLNSGPFISAAGRLGDLNFTDCCAWNGNMICGLSNKAEPELSMNMSGTWWVSGLVQHDDPEFGNFETHDVQNNRFATVAVGRYFYYPTTYGGARVWNNNQYFGQDNTLAFPSGQDFAQWRTNTGYDADSTLDVNLPASAWIRIYPCALAPRVAHLVIYNWAGSDSLDVDVSSLNLANGNYRLRNAYDPINDYEDFAYSGGEIAVSFSTRTIATPLAYASPLASLDARFGAFVLELQA